MDEADEEIMAPLLASAARFLSMRHSPQRMKLSAPAGTGSVERALWNEMASLGWLAMRVPTDRGGAGLPIAQVARLTRMFGKAMLPEPFVAGTILPGALLSALPDAEPVNTLLDMLASGALMMTLGWQEQPGLYDGRSCAALWQAGRLRGRKRFVPNIDTADLLLATAQGDRGTVLLSVPVAAPGIVHTLARAGDGSQRANLDFDTTDVTVLAEGPEVDRALALALDEATLLSAAFLEGLADGMIERIVDYLNLRVQFDRPLAAFQVLRHRVVDLRTECRLSAAAWRRAAALWDNDPQANITGAAISAAKARAGDAAVQCGRAGIQYHGGLGFAEEADLGLAMRIALQHASSFGTSTQHRRRLLSLSSMAA